VEEDGERSVFLYSEMIAIESSAIAPAVLTRLITELSQASMGQSGRLKLLINKAPEGAKSPNLADALVMGRFPAKPRAAPPPAVGGMFGPKVLRG
jgi:hypothetical protein